MAVRRSPELEQLAEEGRQAFERKDEDWRARHLADGEVVSFGSAPEEIWHGRDAVLGLQMADIAEMNESAGIKYEQDSVEGYEAGDAGFVITHGRFVLADGSAVPTRGVNFLTRDGGEWKTVVFGMSVLPSNDLLTAGSPLAQSGVTA